MHRYMMAVALSVCACACDGDGSGGGGSSGGGAGAGGITNRTCDTLTACGGDIDGTWTVQDLCVANAARLAGMATDEPACAGLFVGAQTDGTGTVTFNAGSASSSIVMTVDLHAVWTPACLKASGGLQTVDVAATCANLDQRYGANPSFTGASCMVVGADCDCVVSTESSFSLGSSYTLSGTQIMFSGESSPTDYCVDGDSLQLNATMGDDRALFTLTR